MIEDEVAYNFPTHRILANYLNKDEYIRYSQTIQINNIVKLICDHVAESIVTLDDLKMTVQTVLKFKKDVITDSGEYEKIKTVFINALVNYNERKENPKHFSNNRFKQIFPKEAKDPYRSKL